MASPHAQLSHRVRLEWGPGRRRRDRGKGFGEDVDVAAELDGSPYVPVLDGAAFVRAQ